MSPPELRTLNAVTMLPSQEFIEVLRITRLCSRVCGADIADKNYKVNGITYLVTFCITVYFIFSIYTVQLKFAENWSILLESFCMVGSVFQGISKLLTGIVYTKSFSSRSDFLLSIYVEYEKKGHNYKNALNKSVSRLRVILKIISVVWALLIISSIAVPWIFFMLTSRRLLVMQFYMPGLDPETTFGYFATIGMQTTCMVFGSFGNFAGDMYMLLFFGHILLLVDIFILKREELNNLTIDVDSPMISVKLKELLNLHQTYTQYTEECDKVFFWINFTQITTSGLSIVLTMCIIFTGDWPGSYAYLGLSFCTMYLYCGLGTIVEIANDKIVDAIYAIYWYKLTISQQKTVQFMLMKSQSPKEVTVGGVAPLSINTGLQVTKTVYSVFMMLLNFFS